MRTLEKLEMLRLLYGSPMEVLASCLRGCIVASPGKTFFCGDYAGIEARVLFWVAKHEEGLAIFRDGRDIYKEMAGAIYKIPPAEVKKDSKERWLGKTAILGLGYNMGVKKFMETCESQGQAIEEELAQTAVTAYRSTHVPVVRAWSNVEKAAKAAVQNPGKKYTVNRTSWWVANKFLWCELPSSRRLAYYGPTIRMVKTSWGEMRPALYHWGVNSVTKKWENAGTYGGRLVENVVQAISRDLMADAMLRAEAKGYEVVLSVHDELLAERPAGEGSASDFETIMATLPSWADGLPVKVEAWSSSRYRK